MFRRMIFQNVPVPMPMPMPSNMRKRAAPTVPANQNFFSSGMIVRARPGAQCGSCGH